MFACLLFFVLSLPPSPPCSDSREWEIEKPDRVYEVQFYGHVDVEEEQYHWRGGQKVLARAYDVGKEMTRQRRSTKPTNANALRLFFCNGIE